VVASIISKTLSSASEVRKNATARAHFAGNTAKRETGLPPAISLKSASAAAGATAAGGAALKKLSGGARLVAPRDELVTARLESNLASDIQVLNQASRNAGEVSAILQTAAAAVGDIDAKLERMAELATAALGSGISDHERAVLDNEFAELRDEIDALAGAARFANAPILNGANRFSAGSLGSNIQSGDGFQSFTFDSRAGGEFAASGDGIAIAYDSASNIFTVTNLATGRTASSEAIASAPAAGETFNVDIGEFGLTIQLNESFSASTDITANNSFTIGGSASSQIDLALRIGSGPAAGGDEISVNLQRVRVATLSTELQHDRLDSAAAAANAADHVKSAREALEAVKTEIAAGQTRIGAALENLETGTGNFASASTNLSDLAAAARAVQGALHEVVAENAGALLANVKQVPDILAQLNGLDGLSVTAPATGEAQQAESAAPEKPAVPASTDEEAG
jgi:flagellin